MNYIVFDLEWNQSPIGQAGEHPRMPFEIIEIGAVKLDENYSIVDEFSRLVKPRIYTKLHKIIKQMLSYDEKDLKRDGVPFKQACSEFLKWCGEDSVFCTWGPSDLYYLQNNMDFYYMDKLPFPLKFYNRYSRTSTIRTEISGSWRERWNLWDSVKRNLSMQP